MPRKKQRNQKGSVAIVLRGKSKDMLSLQFSYKGKQQRRALGLKDSPLNRQYAKGIAAKIEADLAFDCFDETFAKYLSTNETVADTPTTIDLFTQFTETRRQGGTSSQRIHSVYKPIISNLTRFGQVIEDEARARAFVDLLRSRQSPGIANQNLSLLKSFGSWCVDTGVWSENHFKPIARLKRVNTVSDRDPFSLDELSQIFTVLQEDKYYSHYHDFCL
ncbi:MAG: DUF3596 domain-containing protein, partial [Cyanothece sp. SIO2G6]|nr:DUF3596 domain-containing protein [Cyanothece sp. SIO2G6]